MLVVCYHKNMCGFTYGRIYRFAYDSNMRQSVYCLVVNDKGIIVSEPKLSFKTLTDWKKYKENDSSLL
jgi:hypothetical protein